MTTTCLDLTADSSVPMLFFASELSDGCAISTMADDRPTASTSSCWSTDSRSIISVATSALVTPLAMLWLRRSLNP